jgi:hypothetical protein
LLSFSLSLSWGGILRTKFKSWASIVALTVAVGCGVVAPVVVMAQAFNPVVVSARPISGSVVLAAGLATVALQNGGYVNTPVCVATEQTGATRFIQISALSATSMSLTSSVTTSNTDTVDYYCVGNPN